jgi:hypothetical protein
LDLKDFIRESLVQIANGISEANIQLVGTSAVVNPSNVQAYSAEAKAYGRINEAFSAKEALVELVEFDVAVTTESGTQTGGGIKISVASIGVGAEGKSTGSQSRESRIKFKIPMIYPSPTSNSR